MGNLVSIHLIAATAASSFVLGVIYQRKQYETIIEMDNYDVILRPRWRGVKVKPNADINACQSFGEFAQHVSSGLMNNGLNLLISLTSGQCFETSAIFLAEPYHTTPAEYDINDGTNVWEADATPRIVELADNNNEMVCMSGGGAAGGASSLQLC